MVKKRRICQLEIQMFLLWFILWYKFYKSMVLFSFQNEITSYDEIHFSSLLFVDLLKRERKRKVKKIFFFSSWKCIVSFEYKGSDELEYSSSDCEWNSLTWNWNILLCWINMKLKKRKRNGPDNIFFIILYFIYSFFHSNLIDWLVDVDCHLFSLNKHI